MEYLIRRCIAIILSFGFVFYAGLPASANANTGVQDATKLGAEQKKSLLNDQLRLMSGLQELQTTLTSAQKKLPRWPELQPLSSVLAELQNINNEYFLKMWLLRSGPMFVPQDLQDKLNKFKASISDFSSLPFDPTTSRRVNDLLSSVSAGIDKEKGRQPKSTTASASSTTQEQKPKGPGDSTLSDQLRLMSGLQELQTTLTSAQTKLPSWPDAKPLNSFLSELLQINNDYFLKVWLLRSGPMYLPKDLLEKLEKLAAQFPNISSISFEEQVQNRLSALLGQLPGQIEKEKKRNTSSSSSSSSTARQSTAAQTSNHRGSAVQLQRDQLQLRGHLQDLQTTLTTAQTKLPRWPEIKPLSSVLTELQDINNDYFLKVWLLSTTPKNIPSDLLEKLEKFKASISDLSSLPLDTKTKDRLNELLGQIPGEIDRERRRQPANSAQSQSQVQTTQTQKPKNVDARQLLNDQLRLMSGLQELQTTLTSAQKKLPRWPEVKPLDSVLSDLQKINNEYFLKVWLLRSGPMYVPQDLQDKLNKFKTTIGEFSSLPFDPTTSRRVNDLLSSVSTGIEKEKNRNGTSTSSTRTRRAAPTPAAAPAAQVSARQSSAPASGRRAKRSLADAPVQSRITQESRVAHPSARSVSAPSTRAAATPATAPAAAAKPRKKHNVQSAHAATSAPKPRTKRSTQEPQRPPAPAPKTSALAGLFAHLPLNIPPLQLPKLALPPIQLPKITLPKITLPPIPPLKIEWPPAPKIPPIKWPW